MKRKEILDWLRTHPDEVHDAPDELLARCEEEVHEHANEDAWLHAKHIAEAREHYWHEAWGAHASQAFVAREVCGKLAGDLRRREPIPGDGSGSHFVDSDVLEVLEPDARDVLLRYVRDLAQLEEHESWLQVIRFTRELGHKLARRGGFSADLDFARAPHYAKTAERVMHILAGEYERHAHPASR